VASFSFDAGNASKLAAIPLYAAGRVATLLIPRTSPVWVFGSGAGIGDGALELWRVAAADGRRAVWLTGSAREERDAAVLGIPTLPKTSLAGFWRTARARVVVVTHGFGDVNRYAVSGAYVVQLWHGIPLKRIGLDSPATLRTPRLISRGPRALASVVRRLLAVMYGGAASRIRLLPAASHLVRGRLQSAFGLADDRVPVTGEPRVDVLSRGSASERRAGARARVAALSGAVGESTRLVLYAPTWRDGAGDPAIPTDAQWARLTELLDHHDAALLVRSHPLGAGDYAPPRPSPRVRMLGSDLIADVTPVLPAFDALVTDYSSLVYDSALVPLPVVFLAPDIAEYAAERGFYGVYSDVSGEDPAQDWDAAIVRLDELLADADVASALAARAERLSATVHAHRDGRNTERVYRAVLAAIAPTGPQEEGQR
jgi:CDP-glycerol glycerophosphotransferase (TagB/SpsB family)